MSNPQLPIKINNFSGLTLASDTSFDIIFHNLDFNQEPHISAVLGNTRRDLIIKPKYAAQYNEKIVNTGNINSIAENKSTVHSEDFPTVRGLLLEFKDGRNDKKFTSEISLSDNMTKIAGGYKEKLLCSFHGPQFSMTMLPRQIRNCLSIKNLRRRGANKFAAGY
jgi:hypothetical protein